MGNCPICTRSSYLCKTTVTHHEGKMFAALLIEYLPASLYLLLAECGGGVAHQYAEGSVIGQL